MAADSVEQVIYEYLTADSTFMAKFEGVYWLELDASEYPYIVFWLIDDAGTNSVIGKKNQGEARIQFDLWDDNKIRSSRLRNVIAEKLRELSESRNGYHVMINGITEQALQRASHTDPYHHVIDGVIRWYKE